MAAKKKSGRPSGQARIQPNQAFKLGLLDKQNKGFPRTLPACDIPNLNKYTSKPVLCVPL